MESAVGRVTVPMRMAGWLRGVRTLRLGFGFEGVESGGLGLWFDAKGLGGNGIGRLRGDEWREEVAVRGRPRWTSSKIVRTFGSSISVAARSLALGRARRGGKVRAAWREERGLGF